MQPLQPLQCRAPSHKLGFNLGQENRYIVIYIYIYTYIFYISERHRRIIWAGGNLSEFNGTLQGRSDCFHVPAAKRNISMIINADSFLSQKPVYLRAGPCCTLKGWISPALRPNSERFQQGSRTVPVLRSVHFRVTNPRPQRLKPNRFAVGNKME